MDCAAARNAMLEAEPSELLAGGASELSRHLATCDRCRATAGEILAAERGLAEWLAAARPALEDAAAVARAAAIARRRAAARRVAWRAAPILAAAAVAALLLVPREHQPPIPAPVAPAAPAPGFSVTAPPGRDLVVLHTQNPKIVVVWYVQSRRSS